MIYIKAREEFIWKQWKETEEEKLRELGVDEAIIAKLREFDWERFKSDRRFYEHQMPDSEEVEKAEDRYGSWEIPQPLSVPELIDAIDDKEIKRELMRLDRTTLLIILLKTFGYKTKKIADLLGMEPNTVSARMTRLRKKFKKFLV